MKIKLLLVWIIIFSLLGCGTIYRPPRIFTISYYPYSQAVISGVNEDDIRVYKLIINNSSSGMKVKLPIENRLNQTLDLKIRVQFYNEDNLFENKKLEEISILGHEKKMFETSTIKSCDTILFFIYETNCKYPLLMKVF